MEVRSYYATTIEVAMDQARRELGPDAMLIQSRRTTDETAHLGRYEVIFAGDRLVASAPPPPTAPAHRPAVATPAAKPSFPAPASAPTVPGAQIQRREPQSAAVAPPRNTSRESVIERIRLRAGAPKVQKAPPLAPVDLIASSRSFESFLETAGIPPEESQRFFRSAIEPNAGAAMVNAPSVPAPNATVASAPQTMPAQPTVVNRSPVSRPAPTPFPSIARPSGEPAPIQDPVAVLAASIRCDPSLGRAGFESPTVALIGPSGAGKTTTLVKLAVQRGLAVGLPVRLACLMENRPGASAHLERFASLLGMDVFHLDSLAALQAMLSSSNSRQLTLIDTPGISRTQPAALQDLANVLRACPEIDSQIVLRADRKSVDLLSILDRYSQFRPSRAILTALDETERPSDLQEILDRLPLPVSFLASGQRIPEDLVQAESFRLATLVLRGSADPSRAVA